MANLRVVPDPSEIPLADDHEAVEEYIRELQQAHRRELRIFQTRINNLVQENLVLHERIQSLEHALDFADAALQGMEANFGN